MGYITKLNNTIADLLFRSELKVEVIKEGHSSSLLAETFKVLDD